MKWITITLPLLLIAGTFSSAQSQEDSTFGMQRNLRDIDQQVSNREQKRELLKQVLAQIPSKKRLSAVQVDEGIFSKTQGLEKQINEYLAAAKEIQDSLPEASPNWEEKEKKLTEMWRNLGTNLRALEESVRAQQRAMFEIVDYKEPMEERLRMELYRLGRAHGDVLDRRSFQELQEATYILSDTVRDPDVQRLEGLASKYLPKIREELRSIKPKLEQGFDSLRNGAEVELATVESELESLKERQSALVNEIGKRTEGQLKIDETVLTFTLPVFAGVLAVILIVPLFYPQATQGSIIQSNVVLEMATVFLLTSTILILGISEKISGEVLGTLIGGISGYVLGRWRRSGKKDPGGGT